MTLTTKKKTFVLWKSASGGDKENVPTNTANMHMKVNKTKVLHMREKSIRVPVCSNGPSCEWLERGCCSYFHPRVGVQRPWTRKESKNRRRQDTRSQNDTRFHQDTGSSQEIRFLDTRPRHDKEKPEPEGTKSLERILQQYQTYK